MDIWQWILTGGVGVAVLKIVEDLIKHWITKKNEKEDQIKQLIEDQKKQIDKLTEAQMVSMRDRIKHLAVNYIKVGEIHEDDWDSLSDMHTSYKKLGGNGHLDDLMEKVSELKLLE